MANIIEGGYSHDNHSPHGKEERREHRRHGEWVQRGMEIEMLPQRGEEHLYGGVECGRGRDEKTEKGGIERVDVVEMYDICLLPQHLPYQIACAKERHYGKKDDEMGVGEVGDEL